MKTITQLIGKKSEWTIVTESGEILERFRLKTTAQQSLARFRLNKREKLYIEEVEV